MTRVSFSLHREPRGRVAVSLTSRPLSWLRGPSNDNAELVAVEERLIDARLEEEVSATIYGSDILGVMFAKSMGEFRDLFSQSWRKRLDVRSDQRTENANVVGEGRVGREVWEWTRDIKFLPCAQCDAHEGTRMPVERAS